VALHADFKYIFENYKLSYRVLFEEYKTRKKFSLKLITKNVTLRSEQFSCSYSLRHKNIPYHINKNVFLVLLLSISCNNQLIWMAYHYFQL